MNIHDNGTHTYLACILWALREVLNETAGVPPWLLVFGRLPRGPLAIFRDAWIDAEEPPFNLGKSIAEYLKGLREQLASVESFAATHANAKQRQYCTQYNLRSRDKSFDIGEQVSTDPRQYF